MWQDRRSLRASDPSPDGLARLGDELGVDVVGVERMGGGVATSTHALRLADASELILKRYATDDDTAPLEWARLQAVTGAPIATPAPVALDDAGRWFGVRSLVMTRLPGRVRYPVDPAVLGTALAAIHATVVPDPPPQVLVWPPYWDVVPAQERVLCHGDFHPGNVLVGDDGAVTGVVDWSGARLAARGMDVGIARCDVGLEPGGDAPDVLLDAYEDAAGVRIEHLALWDAQAVGRASKWCHEWLDSWHEVDVPMTLELARERIAAFDRRWVSHPVRKMTS